MIRYALRGPSLAVVACALALASCATTDTASPPAADGSNSGASTDRTMARGLDYA
eukprot:gene12416-16550_t